MDDQSLGYLSLWQSGDLAHEFLCPVVGLCTMQRMAFQKTYIYCKLCDLAPVFPTWPSPRFHMVFFPSTDIFNKRGSIGSRGQVQLGPNCRHSCLLGHILSCSVASMI